MTPHQGEFPKTCSTCGVIYLDLFTWRELPYKSTQRVASDPDDQEHPEEYLMESRDCTCKSTLSVNFSPS